MTIRQTLFTVHMWVGLILGVLLAALGLSGSLLVYDDTVAAMIDPPPKADTAGMPLPLTMIADIAREAAAQKGLEGGQLQLMLPQHPLEAVSVRIGGISPMGNMPGMRNGAAMKDMPGMKPEGRRRHRTEAGGTRGGEGGGARGLLLFIDPVSGEVLGSRNAALPGLLVFAHQLHGNFLMGRDGRTLVVGWLGVAMCILGVTGLVLWWPRNRNQWKYAFGVRRSATGLRFHRELHAATGIWIFIVFMAVSVSGVVIAWPQVTGMNPPGFNPRAMPTIAPIDGAKPFGATEAVIAAQAAVPGLEPRSVTLPGRPDQPITVSYLSHDAMNASVLVDPYRAKVIAVRDQSNRFMAWMRPVHQGSLGPVWRFLVFLSGLVPTLFVVTGVIMWLKKRRRHVPMTVMAEDVATEEAVA